MEKEKEQFFIDSLFATPSETRKREDYQVGFENGKKDSSLRSSATDFAEQVTHIFHKAKRKALGVAD